MQSCLKAAVKQTGRALAYAAAELQADQKIVLAAVAQDGFALRFALLGGIEDVGE